MLRVDNNESPEAARLFWVARAPGEDVCCGIVSSGQGVRCFCTQPVEPGTDGCGTGSNITKAAVAARSWYVTTGIRGNVRAGLLDKRLAGDGVLLEDRQIFDSEEHTAGKWLSRFQVAKMAKLGACSSLSAQTAEGRTASTDIRDYAKTRPNGRGRARSWKTPPWVNVEDEGQGFDDMKVWGPLTTQVDVNPISLANFELLKRETVRAASN
jgi:hypothetical protein